ncbi:MAG: hypothetical protein HKN21_13260, partial [Candidatus Eisenbacteria bacterium]|nr:hypothetical protein [Candidatus Eisenbacteria bacterium]
MSPSAGNPRSSGQSLGLSLGAVALALLISICGFQPTFAATPSSGTLDSGTTYLSWTGGNISGANSDESTCVDGVTCETFTLKLAPGTYPNTRIRVRMDWLLLANDYDLYIHQNTVNGPVVASSGQGTTAFEETFISLADSVVVDTLVYVCNIVAWSVGPGDNYAGEAEIAATANPRTPIYQAGTLTFSENVALKAPIAASDGEPSVRVDIRGNCYVGGIRGVPAGVDLWRFDLDQNSPTFDPGMQNPTYLGQP